MGSWNIVVDVFVSAIKTLIIAVTEASAAWLIAAVTAPRNLHGGVDVVAIQGARKSFSTVEVVELSLIVKVTQES